MNNGIVDSSLATIGDTPLVRLQRIVPDGAAQVIVKLETGNPTGSYKDRMALAIIEEAEHRGDLEPGQCVVEYSGGSTGSSLAYVCAVKGYPCTIISSDTFDQVGWLAAPRKTDERDHEAWLRGMLRRLGAGAAHPERGISEEDDRSRDESRHDQGVCVRITGLSAREANMKRLDVVLQDQQIECLTRRVTREFLARAHGGWLPPRWTGVGASERDVPILSVVRRHLYLGGVEPDEHHQRERGQNNEEVGGTLPPPRFGGNWLWLTHPFGLPRYTSVHLDTTAPRP